MKKIIIGIFAVIGMVSVVLALVGIGYFAGRNNIIAIAPVSNVTATPEPIPTVESVVTNTPVLTPTVAPTATSTPKPTVAPTATSTPSPEPTATSQVIPTSTPMPTELPKQEDLTFTAMDRSISRFSLVDLPVWSEATDFGKKVGVIKAEDALVVVDNVCNETGYYHVMFGTPEKGRIDEVIEGYIHPDHFRYLTTAEEEYQKKVEAGLINPDEIPSDTPSTEAPTPAPTAKPTEAPSESPTQKPTETPAKPTETPAKPTEKPTATPTPKPSTPSATDYNSYKIKYKYFKDYITGYTDEGYPILPDGNILTPTTTPETLGYNPATIDGYTEEGYVIIGGTPWIPRDWENWGDASDGGTINPDFDYSGSGIH